MLEFGEKRLHFCKQNWERLLHSAPNERIVDLIVVAVSQTIPRADDPVKVGDLFRCSWINCSQTTERFANDFKIALDSLSHLAVVEGGIERLTFGIFSDEPARPCHVVEQLRGFWMHPRSPFASSPPPARTTGSAMPMS